MKRDMFEVDRCHKAKKNIINQKTKSRNKSKERIKGIKGDCDKREKHNNSDGESEGGTLEIKQNKGNKK